MSLNTETTMQVVPAYGNNGGGMFGCGNDWWLLILFLFGFGGYGYGGFGGMGGGAGFQGMATRADINAGFAFNDLQNGIRSIERGICDGFYGVQSAINGIGHQISDCCCATQRAIDGVNYNMATNFCQLGNTFQSAARDIIDNQNANYRGMMDFMVGEKLAAKDATIAQLQQKVALSEQSALFGARIDAAVAEILRRTGNDCPTAAYLVQPPTPVNFPVNGCGTVQFSNCNRYGVAA